MSTAFGGLMFLGILAYGIAQLVIGYAGIEYHIGAIWGGLALAAALIFRFTLPITIGSFFGAMHVLGWHWLGALAFAAPGLLLIVPGVIAALIDGAKYQRA